MFYNAYLGTLKSDVNLKQLDGSFELLDFLSASLKHSSNLSYLTLSHAEEMGLKNYFPDYDSYLHVGSKTAILKCLDYMGEDTENFALRMDDDKEYAILLIVEEYGETVLKDSYEAERFWTRVQADLSESIEVEYLGKGRSFTIKGSAEGFALDCTDWGEDCEMCFGKDEYEFHYTLCAESTRAFILALRKAYGTEQTLQSLMDNIFCCDSGTIKFRKILEKNHINYGFVSF